MDEEIVERVLNEERDKQQAEEPAGPIEQALRNVAAHMAITLLILGFALVQYNAITGVVQTGSVASLWPPLQTALVVFSGVMSVLFLWYTYMVNIDRFREFFGVE